MPDTPCEATRASMPQRFWRSLVGIRMSFRLVRYLLACVLFVAATLKAFFPVTESMAPSFSVVVILFELLLAVWLISGLLPQLSWCVASLCFAVFATISVMKIAAGETDCGCFGVFSVPPLAALGLDLLMLIALLASFPNVNITDFTPRLGRSYPPTAISIGSSIVVFASLAGVFATTMIERSETAFMDPQRWQGQRFPLLPYIDISSELVIGDWTVVLYRSECGQCKSFLRAMADDDGFTIDSDAERIALVALDDGPRLSMAGRIRCGQLTEETLQLSLPTPLAVKLFEGTVVDVIEPAKLLNVASL